VNQDILNLYLKAQNGGLSAQEVFWLEGQAASFPSFAMAHMILARHHFRNQSTIKNRALLKAAAYASNRTLLRHYLEDALPLPKVKPSRNGEAKPAPLPEEKQAATINLKKEEEKAAETPAVETIQVETPAVETVQEENPTVETVQVETPAVETVQEENPTVETVQVETPDSESVDPVKAEAETPSPEQQTAETPIAETPEEKSSTIETSASADAPAQPIPGPKAGEVNWFLNMRVKLRADKYKILSKRLHGSVAEHALKLEALIPASTGKPPAEAPNLPPIAEEQLLAETSAPITDFPKEENLEPAPVETVIEVKVEQPVTQLNQPQEEAPLISPVVVEVNPAVTPPEDEKRGTHSFEKTHSPPAEEKHITPTVPEKEYEIGAFSSFTFLSEGETEEEDETASMDTDIATLEAVEFQALDGKEGIGEIIFEENDRIVEVIISPEALEKYFKGRLPATESESSEHPSHKESRVASGEFKIELDELEYRGQDEDLSNRHEKTGTENDRKPATVHSKPHKRPQPEALIEKFIENEPSITRAKATQASPGDLSKESSLVDEEWVTETLARIYEKQGNKAKAIKIYEKLRLRIPEKSDYFGLLIEKLKH
jgi:hypothetical protein